MTDDTKSTYQEIQHIEWIKKSQVNYFSCFMELWVGFNAWLKKAYDQMQDRECLELLKQRKGNSEELFSVFEYLLNNSSLKEALLFRSNIEALHYTLSGDIIKYPEGPKSKFDSNIVELRSVGFNSALPVWAKRKSETGYHDLLFGRKPETSEEEWEEEQRIEEDPNYRNLFIELDQVRLINDPEVIFASLIEIIYQVRCHLFHGHLNPTNQAHYDMVKYSYELLFVMAIRLEK